MKTFSAIAEIQRLLAMDIEKLDDDPSTPALSLPASALDEINKSLARLGKEQWRANQQAETLVDQGKIAVEEMQQSSAALREQSDEHRREGARLREDAKATAAKVLTFIDSLDDVRVLALQHGDAQWLKYIERLTADAVTMLQSIGLTEIPVVDRVFDPEEHEAVDTVERPVGGRQYAVVEVVQRGFRYRGTVLRRARVITAR
jgi:molecular chaperone GrpE